MLTPGLHEGDNSEEWQNVGVLQFVIIAILLSWKGCIPEVFPIFCHWICSLFLYGSSVLSDRSDRSDELIYNLELIEKFCQTLKLFLQTVVIQTTIHDKFNYFFPTKSDFKRDELCLQYNLSLIIFSFWTGTNQY